MNMDSKYKFEQSIFLLIEQKEELINEIQYISVKLDIKKEKLKTIKKFLKENCKHDYVEDFVSSGLDDIQHIEYCKLCDELK